jgi:hypothetical protein
MIVDSYRFHNAVTVHNLTRPLTGHVKIAPDVVGATATIGKFRLPPGS